jgi:hypothetical protein
MALLCWSIVEDGSLRIGSASVVVDRIVSLDESWDKGYWLKLVIRKEFYCNGLIVKSLIFLI